MNLYNITSIFTSFLIIIINYLLKIKKKKKKKKGKQSTILMKNKSILYSDFFLN